MLLLDSLEDFQTAWKLSLIISIAPQWHHQQLQHNLNLSHRHFHFKKILDSIWFPSRSDDRKQNDDNTVSNISLNVCCIDYKLKSEGVSVSILLKAFRYAEGEIIGWENPTDDNCLLPLYPLLPVSLYLYWRVSSFLLEIESSFWGLPACRLFV